MKNIIYLFVLVTFLNTTSFYAQTTEPLDPMGDPGAVPINSNVIFLMVFATFIIAFIVLKQKIKQSKSSK